MPEITAGLGDYEIPGSVAVVTGAAKGIGAATAALLAKAGATVVCVDNDADGARATADGIAAAGGAAQAEQVDVRSRDEVLELGRRVAEEHGRIDSWVNVAGVLQRARVTELTEDAYERVFAVNFRGALWGLQAAAAGMQAGGSVVNVVSAAIDFPAPGLTAYATSKAALNQLTRTAAVELGEQGIRVNAIAPGWIETPMTQAANFQRPDGSIDEQARQAVIEGNRSRSPLQMVGEPIDIAHGVLYLVSPASRFVTGQTLRINGGVAMV